MLEKNTVFKKIIFICFLFFLPFSVSLPAQEALKSVEEEYYDFLALLGLTEHPTLNYRTLSDSVWAIDEEADHPWQGNNLGAFHPLFGDFRMRMYGPELFMSANTFAPYGSYDGVLWQGRGFNALFKGGVRFEGYGIELTLLPHFAFSQNSKFDILPSNYDNEYGYFWGYWHNVGVDAPQRFGSEPFFDWDFGDSEIRYTWKTLTVGFGTQTFWLGPSYLNPILHSNNAPAYPKFDIGLRRQKVTIPHFGYAGDIEFRLWIGRLCKSDYFDNDDSNKYTMYHGLSFAYAPSFLQGLTLFANRVCLVPWEWKNINYIIPSGNNIIEDQKYSIGFSWIFPQVGFEVFGELGFDDYADPFRHPNHTTVFNLGLKKNISIIPSKKIYGQLLLELNYMEKTPEYYAMRYSFYSHQLIIHGYTNKGQWLGNAVSPIGNAQSIKFTLYYPKGNSGIMISRNNPNNHYVYENEYESGEGRDSIYHNAYWSNVNFDITTVYLLKKYFHLLGCFSYNVIINHNYQRHINDLPPNDDIIKHNFSFQLGFKFLI